MGVPINKACLPNLPLSSAAVVKNLICNGNVLHVTAHWHR